MLQITTTLSCYECEHHAWACGFWRLRNCARAVGADRDIEERHDWIACSWEAAKTDPSRGVTQTTWARYRESVRRAAINPQNEAKAERFCARKPLPAL
ncbi:hypothetical protein M404DRAFT_755001 [Pisolithus tinctorius Marx 270]|uniref:Uncharacterized protein n=1 Tax=Pisolithus tinctorius Marx 270 TaxID=870435 RepID=A0A0C3JT14_PISTI|nr:hypothetical protein M404DRAFT_755001 [Pisolithus tinctorius Marx 270]